MFILIINRPLNDSQSFKTKSNIAQTLKHLDKPIIDLSGWQRPEEINYDALSQNISGAIVRVHSGAQTTKENDASFINGIDKAYKSHITELQKRNVPVAVYAYVAGKSVQEMEKAAEVFYNAASPYSPSYYWLDVEDKTMSNMNEGVENFRAKLASLGAKTSASTLVSTSWKNTVLIQASLPLFGFRPTAQTQDFWRAVLKLI